MPEYFSYELFGGLVTAIFVVAIVYALFRKRFLKSEIEDLKKLELLIKSFVDTQQISNELMKKGLIDMTTSTTSMCAAMQEVTIGVTKMAIKIEELLKETAIENSKKGKEKDK